MQADPDAAALNTTAAKSGAPVTHGTLRIVEHPQSLRYVGLVAWAMVGGWLLVTDIRAAHESTGYPINVWILAHLAFGFSYWIASQSSRSRKDVISHVCAFVLVACSIAVSYYSQTGLGGILLMVTASILPWLMSLSATTTWVVIANLTATAVLLFPPVEMPLLAAAMQLFIYAGFSAFMVAGSCVAIEQTNSRQSQDRLGAELLTTRLLHESALLSERARISRDVHDLLGHHLTALILNLEVAGRLASGQAKDHLDQSHALARLLLADVRDVVAKLRGRGTIDLREAIQQVLDAHPNIASVLEFNSPVLLDEDGSVVILWCVREILATAVVQMDVDSIRIESWRDPEATIVSISSTTNQVSALLEDGHLRKLQTFLSLHQGTIRADQDAGSIVLSV